LEVSLLIADQQEYIAYLMNLQLWWKKTGPIEAPIVIILSEFYGAVYCTIKIINQFSTKYYSKYEAPAWKIVGVTVQAVSFFSALKHLIGRKGCVTCLTTVTCMHQYSVVSKGVWAKMQQ